MHVGNKQKDGLLCGGKLNQMLLICIELLQMPNSKSELIQRPRQRLLCKSLSFVSLMQLNCLHYNNYGAEPLEHSPMNGKLN